MKPLPAYPDPLLADLLKQKDPGACNFLYEKYAGAIYGLIGQILPGERSVNELLVEVFVSIIDSIHEYDPSKGRLFTWMMQEARQIAIDRLKAGSQQPSKVPAPAQKNSSGVKGLISKLQEDERQVISLAYLEGYSVEEVAGRLGIPAEIVKAKMNKGLAAINSPL